MGAACAKTRTFLLGELPQMCGRFRICCHNPKAGTACARKAGGEPREAEKRLQGRSGGHRRSARAGKSALRFLRRRVNAESAHFFLFRMHQPNFFFQLVKRSAVAADVKQFRRLGLVAVGLLHGHFDKGALNLLQARGRLPESKAWQVLAVDDLEYSGGGLCAAPAATLPPDETSKAVRRAEGRSHGKWQVHRGAACRLFENHGALDSRFSVHARCRATRTG